eukprot:CAMPEP_0171802622 /NCGR_PEP_ID=MMETSP0991-20121206/72962_1 /TAXON_ID=483369 /ORGANISM="non described non described, Strain CCMP2098" /LENGTH=71 /DNA_ID=CAMNT_0012414513 /DNA_START=51 /DNA_END=263 /DNA_ORIENTATION=+
MLNDALNCTPVRKQILKQILAKKARIAKEKAEADAAVASKAQAAASINATGDDKNAHRGADDDGGGGGGGE